MNFLNRLSDIDLGSSLLSASLALGFFLLFLTIIRSIEIPIKIYIAKRKNSGESSQSNQK